MAKRFNEINEEETLYMFILVRHLPPGKSLVLLQITNNLIAPTGVLDLCSTKLNIGTHILR